MKGFQDYSIEETVEWLKNCQVLDLTYEKLQSYLKVGDPGCIQLNSYDFCDKQIYDSIKQAKVYQCYFEKHLNPY